MLALLEGLLRLLPVISGLEPGRDTDSWPLRNFEPHRAYRYSYTWAMLNTHAGVTNNYGQISTGDFRPGSRPLIVVGDSFIESLMNDYEDTLQGILGQSLGPSRPVYGLAASGLSASDFFVLARQARAEFAPVAAAFLISDGDISKSLLRRPGGYFLRAEGSTFAPTYVPRTPDPAMQWVRAHMGEPALYRYVRGNLKFAPGDILAALAPGKGGTATTALEPGQSAETFAVADWFLDQLPRVSGLAPQCVALLLDADRYAIYDPQLASQPKDSVRLRSHFIERARELGYRIVDMEPLFRAEYAKTRMKFDYWPVDRHWNRHGHEVAAEAVMSALFANDANSCMQGEALPAS
jgi:hypothetical protein